MEEREEELIFGKRNKVERKNKEESMEFLSAWALQSLPSPYKHYPHNQPTTYLIPWSNQLTTHNSSTIHLQYSPVTAHSHAPTCRHTRTPSQQYTHHLCTHTCILPCTPLHKYLQISTLSHYSSYQHTTLKFQL